MNKAVKKIVNLMMAFVLILALFIPTNVEAAPKVKLNKTKLTLYLGSTETLKITGTSKKITWSSSNKKVATVNSKGKVTPKKEGKATITAKVSGKKYSCKVTVKKPYISDSKKTIYVGKTHTLKLVGTDIKSVKSSNSKVAAVNKKGMVTAKKAGTATITLKGKDGKKYTCKVTVKKPYLNKTKLELFVGEGYTLKLTGATIKTTTSSDTSVVTVNRKGRVIAQDVGNAVITVRDTKNRVYKCKVVVSSLEEEDGRRKVYTAKDLLKIIDYPYDEFVLMNDINLSKVTWTTIPSFSGKLDGNGYTISNVSVRLFETLERGSLISNLTIKANIKSFENDAILSRNANGIIKNCVTQGKIYTSDMENAPMSIAGIVALNNGVIEDCRNEAAITQYFAGDRWASVAGIAGLNYGRIENCKNTGKIISKSRGTGGIVGNAYYISSKYQNGIVINCENTGEIICTYEGNDIAAVGGIAGVNQALVYNCKNTGSIISEAGIEQNVYIGGICGEASEFAYILACKNTAPLQYGICGRALINSCWFDENDKPIYEGNIIIADCVNDIDNLSEDQANSYVICGLTEVYTNTITLTRCENILNGKKSNTYIYETHEYQGGTVKCEENGTVLKNTITSGKPYKIAVGEKLGLNEQGNSKYVSVLIDRFGGVCIDEKGEFYGAEPDEAVLYAITKDGKVITHKVTVK